MVLQSHIKVKGVTSVDKPDTDEGPAPCKRRQAQSEGRVASCEGQHIISSVPGFLGAYRTQGLLCPSPWMVNQRTEGHGDI